MPSQDWTPDYNVDKVAISTCGQLYSSWSSKKSMYKLAQPQGLDLVVEYADSLGMVNGQGVEIDRTAETVLCLHGAPGSHKDFAHLIKDLAAQGKRVIVPNFPTYKLTETTKLFRHSAQEKKEYVKDFLKAIGVSEIECLVSHSSAIYPTCLLWREDNGITIKAIAFINPSGHRRIKAMKPKFLTSVSVRVYQVKLGRALMRMCGTTVLSITGCPVRPDNMDQVILSATTMVYSKFRHLSESLLLMREKQLPILLVFSENDKLVDTDISYEMAAILGAQVTSFTRYDEQTELTSESTDKANPWVVVIPEGGHYSLKNYPKVVNHHVTQFLQSVNNNVFTCHADSVAIADNQELKRDTQHIMQSQLRV
ncbi:hypothetical protein HDE_13143 [Halotydeus destructor]|nr:hypothetical protein HDE_13143 [Halotydeus destructor]